MNAPSQNTYKEIIKDKTFLHGTDARIVRMTNAEREHFHSMCIEICNYLWKFYSTVFDDFGFVRKYFSEENKKIGCRLFAVLSHWRACLNGSTQYQYESKGIYLTTIQFKAEDYAIRSRYFGEVGYNAYIMIQSIKYFKSFDLNPTPEIANNMQKILDFGNEEPEPIIYTIETINVEALYEAFSKSRKRMVDMEPYEISLYQDYYCAEEIDLYECKSKHL